MFQITSYGGRLVEAGGNKFFSGPEDPKTRIEKFFGNGEARQQAVDELYASRDGLLSQHKELRDHCHTLLKFASAKKQSADTQLVTFQILVSVITRYPGIRRLFCYRKDSRKAPASNPPFKDLWTREYQDCGEKWTFYRDFAIFCISKSELTELVENELPSKLGCLEVGEGSWNNGPMETLLALCRTIPEFNFSKLCAIHYLTGILELPSFWLKGANTPKRLFHILSSLCAIILQLIQDTEIVDVNVTPENEPFWMSAARNAVDIFAGATLEGLLHLYRRNLLTRYPPQLPEIVSHFLRDTMQRCFPMSSHRVRPFKDIFSYDAPSQEDAHSDSEGEHESDGQAVAADDSPPAPVRSVKPAADTYIIVNKVRSNHGDKLAMTFTGEGGVVTVTPYSSESSAQRWVLKDWIDGSTQHIQPSSAPALQAAWGSTVYTLRTPAALVWTVRSSSEGYT